MKARAFVCRTDIPCIAPSPPHRRFRLSGPPPFAVPLLPFPARIPSPPALLPLPPSDKVRHNEGAEFRSWPFLAHSDALCPKVGTGSGTVSGPKYSPRLPKTHLPSVNKRARARSYP